MSLSTNLDALDPQKLLARVRSEADWLGLRFTSEKTQRRCVRNEISEQQSESTDSGVMVEAMINGHIAYAATSDLSEAGIMATARKAAQLAKITGTIKCHDFSETVRPISKGRYQSPRVYALDKTSAGEITDQLITASRKLKVSDQVVTTLAEARLVETRQVYLSTNGAEIDQEFILINQHLAAIARDGSETQQRSLNGPHARCWQAGVEVFDWQQLHGLCEQVGREAVELLTAEECPDGRLDLVLSPDQMLLQIHESIGHPLELDRILGDERNYAGWSFVKPADFGNLRYGTELMNVTFDPVVSGEFASYGFDDGGNPATREYLIRQGLLLRGIGGLESQNRSGLPGVACFRASGWNRAPIDRMANINLEPGNSSLEEMIARVERGVYMQSNRSWSIDDYRNKFQFGCEYARLIENGRLTRVLKNPNYRGVTIPFWNSLAAVGHGDEWQSFGTAYCGKGEPNQMIRVGHGSPPCLFVGVEVFGGSS